MNVTPTLQIRARSKWSFDGLADVWAHRALLFHLVRRDLKSMHINSGLGSAWILVQPLAMTAVLTLFLSFLTKVPHQGLPHTLVILSGLTIWSYFNLGVSRASTSLIANSYLLKKIYFPRLLFPLVPMFVGLIEAGVMIVLLVILALFLKIEPTWLWIFIPVPIAMTFCLIIGTGISLAALNVRFRDISSILPITLQLLMYLSPVIYLTDLVPAQFRELYLLNPICGPINLLRWIMLGHGAFPLGSVISTALFSLFAFVIGLFVFKYLEDEFADIV